MPENNFCGKTYWNFKNIDIILMLNKYMYSVYVYISKNIKNTLFQLKCSDIDECRTNPCTNNGVCTNTKGSYLCTCSPGWTSSNCQDGKMHFLNHSKWCAYYKGNVRFDSKLWIPMIMGTGNSQFKWASYPLLLAKVFAVKTGFL